MASGGVRNTKRKWAEAAPNLADTDFCIPTSSRAAGIGVGINTSLLIGSRNI